MALAVEDDPLITVFSADLIHRLETLSRMGQEVEKKRRYLGPLLGPRKRYLGLQKNFIFPFRLKVLAGLSPQAQKPNNCAIFLPAACVLANGQGRPYDCGPGEDSRRRRPGSVRTADQATRHQSR
jgi:hypothetical protein